MSRIRTKDLKEISLSVSGANGRRLLLPGRSAGQFHDQQSIRFIITNLYQESRNPARPTPRRGDEVINSAGTRRPRAALLRTYANLGLNVGVLNEFKDDLCPELAKRSGFRNERP
jgi:hypothetical protein